MDEPRPKRVAPPITEAEAWAEIADLWAYHPLLTAAQRRFMRGFKRVLRQSAFEHEAKPYVDERPPYVLSWPEFDETSRHLATFTAETALALLLAVTIRDCLDLPAPRLAWLTWNEAVLLGQYDVDKKLAAIKAIYEISDSIPAEAKRAGPDTEARFAVWTVLLHAAELLGVAGDRR